MAALLTEVGPGDEVIMPSFTFVSTANAFVLRGARPVFVDVRPDTLNLDESKVEAAITERTRAIVPVHYAGVACEMDTLCDIAARHTLFVVEDAAQGVMATYKGRPLGSIGHAAALSFHETKNVMAGEGGALLVNLPAWTERAEILWEKGTNRTQFARGEVDKYTWIDLGSSYLPSEISAAFLWAQLEQAAAITAGGSWRRDGGLGGAGPGGFWAEAEGAALCRGRSPPRPPPVGGGGPGRAGLGSLARRWAGGAGAPVNPGGALGACAIAWRIAALTAPACGRPWIAGARSATGGCRSSICPTPRQPMLNARRHGRADLQRRDLQPRRRPPRARGARQIPVEDRPLRHRGAAARLRGVGRRLRQAVLRHVRRRHLRRARSGPAGAPPDPRSRRHQAALFHEDRGGRMAVRVGDPRAARASRRDARDGPHRLLALPDLHRHAGAADAVPRHLQAAGRATS